MNNKEKQTNNYIKYINIFLGFLIFFLLIFLLERLYFSEIYYKVPSVVGLEKKEAEKILKKSDLRIRNMGEVFSDLSYGLVAEQEPKAGKIVKKNRNIKIWISKNKPVVFLENLVGLNYVDAISLIEREGLIVEKITKINSSYPINQIVATSPKTGEPLLKGEKISLLVSNGKK